MTKIIDRTFKEALEDGVFPSAEILAAKGDEILFHERYGDAREHTCFDIASLTKPLSTATLCMMLLGEGLLKFDDTIYQWLAGAREPFHKKITVRHLLNHTSGLAAWQPFYRELPLSLVGTGDGKREILESCYREPVENEPGEKTVYSDIGYMILGEILEQAGDAPLDSMFADRIAKPLLLTDTFFIRNTGCDHFPRSRTGNTSSHHVHDPSQKHHAEKKRRFAPTEDCPWRKRVIHGEVHDQNAYAMGGVAGHAGLFSTAQDINTFAAELVKCTGNKSSLIPPEIASEFIGNKKVKSAGEEFVLGWNLPSRRNSASGHFFSASSIGHLGFTGCSIWIDIEAGFRIILLTNRIHPTPMNEKIKSFRPRIHDLIYNELFSG